MCIVSSFSFIQYLSFSNKLKLKKEKMFGGIFGAKFKGDKCGAELNKAMIRMNIHR
jgi:hypothetical protein